MIKYSDGFYHYASPIGTIAIYASATGLTCLKFSEESGTHSLSNHPIIQKCILQFNEYFAGERTTFDLPLPIQGTPLQQQIYNMLCTIPYGATRSYGQIAAALGNIRLARMVGYACHHNPFLIVVPCHRVVAKNNALTGYRGGLDKKAWLLALESTR